MASNQADMEARGVIPADLKAKLPASSAYASAVAPTPDQLSCSTDVDQGGLDDDRRCGYSDSSSVNRIMTVLNNVKRDAPLARPASPKFSWTWLGVMPFFLFAFFFLLYPVLDLGVRSFQDTKTHAFTFKNIVQLLHDPYILRAYWISIKISLVTALGGGIFGFLLAFSAIRGGLPRFMRSSLMTFCGVASNFAGVPLAFAFIALLSPQGG